MKNVVLVILDGWGYGQSWGGNAITIAETLNYDRILRKHPNTLIAASGTSVGLPGHEVGNSEVGHMNIGAGQIVWQDISIINKSIIDGSFYKNEALLKSIEDSKKNNTAIHLMGIVSNGGIHSHIVHLLALLKLCNKIGHNNVLIHAFTDGRDTDPMAGIEFINTIVKACEGLKTGRIATITGRSFLDRKGDWIKTQKVYNAISDGIGIKEKSPLSAISNAYKQGETDEFIKPRIIENGECKVKNNDTIIFFNFRSDRTRQLTTAFLEKNFDKFPRRRIEGLSFISFIPYGIEQELEVNSKSAFSSVEVSQTIGQYYSERNLRQFHLAETEKFAHVTYFINGNRKDPYPLEDRILVPSPDVKSYDLKPEMSAEEVKNELIRHIRRKEYPLIICNFANGDMVGHTGVFTAAVRAVEVLDKIVKEISDICIEMDMPLIITADHGNVEQMVDPQSGQPYTEHTSNPVPFIVLSSDNTIKLKTGGKLANISSTILDLAGIEKPDYFEESLILK
jgi:2,3-bisphosphoglycerate-independent phosphoglycerate mutase